MPVMDYKLLYESMLTQKQEMDAQHQLLGDEVKRLKSVIAKLEENATAQALALKAAKAMQQAETERADASERDAERYRWLLQQAWFQSACDRYDLDDHGLQNRFEALLGATIDQAMKET